MNHTTNLTKATLKLAPMALLAVVAALADAGTYSQYSIVEITPLTGGNRTYAMGVNNLGHVVGYGNVPDPTGAVVDGFERGFYFNGTSKFTVIPDGSGDVGTTNSQKALRSFARAVNDAGQVVGWRDRFNSVAGSNRDRAYVWNAPNGTITNIPNLGASFSFENRAYGINQTGVVTGLSNGRNGSTEYQAFRWTLVGGTVYLGSLTGSTLDFSMGTAINASNAVVGYGVNSAGDDRILRYGPNGPIENLGGYPGPSNTVYEAQASDINDDGVIVGTYQVDFNTFRAFRRTTNGAMGAITMLTGNGSTSDDSNSAAAINNLGDIVGSCEIGNANHRAYINSAGLFFSWTTDLNTLIPANSGWVLEYATDISDTGYIVGYGLKNGQRRGFLLKPMIQVSGKVTLQDYLASPQNQFVTVELRAMGNNALIESKTVQLDANSRYSFATLNMGQFHVTCKASHWLRSKKTNVSLNSDNANVDFTLVNGDVDGDNVVTVFDYNLLSDAFDSTVGDANWNAMADLDGDKSVTVFDYNILSNNFDLSGD